MDLTSHIVLVFVRYQDATDILLRFMHYEIIIIIKKYINNNKYIGRFKS